MWRIFERLSKFFRSIGLSKPAPARSRHLPEVVFNGVVVLQKTPTDSSVRPKEFIEVIYRTTPMWVLFKCPCACGETISLPLQTSHSPHWTVSLSESGRPDLYPSVWRKNGCKSHFWIEDGRVIWCADSGVAPSVARPDIYGRPKSRRIDFQV